MPKPVKKIKSLKQVRVNSKRLKELSDKVKAENPAQEIPEKKLPARTDKFDLGRAIKLRYERRLSYKEISDILGVTPQAIQSRITGIETLLGDKEKTQEFVSRESQILNNAREMLITAALDPETVKKASTLQLTTAYSQLFDKYRLIEGKSTANIAYQDITQSEQEVDRRIRELATSLGLTDTTTIYSGIPPEASLSDTQGIDITQD